MHAGLLLLLLKVEGKVKTLPSSPIDVLYLVLSAYTDADFFLVRRACRSACTYIPASASALDMFTRRLLADCREEPLAVARED